MSTDASRSPAIAPLADLLASGVDAVALLNAHRGTFDKLIGLVFTEVAEGAIAAEVPVSEALLQPYGLVHGGVYATIAETLASAGAAVIALPRGQSVVGLENTTAFLRGTRGGVLRGRARALSAGRRTQVWSVEIADQEGTAVATGRVRVLCLEAGAAVAGEKLTVK